MGVQAASKIAKFKSLVDARKDEANARARRANVCAEGEMCEEKNKIKK